MLLNRRLCAFFLSQDVRTSPYTLLVATPDDDCLIIRPRHNTSVWSPSTPRRKPGTVSCDVLRLATSRVGRAIPGTLVLVELASVSGLEVRLVHCSCLQIILFDAIRQVPESSLYRPHQIAMGSETGNFKSRRPIKDLHLIIAAPAHDPATVILHTSNALMVSEERPPADLIRPVPDLDVSITTSRYNFVIADLNRIHSGTVPFQAPNHCVRRLDRQLAQGIIVTIVLEIDGDG